MQVADYPPGASYGPRRLQDYEFVWVLRGSAVWTVHDGPPGSASPHSQSLPLTPGRLALARTGTVDSYQWAVREASTHAYVHFALNRPAEVPSADTWPATLSMIEMPILGAVCDYLLDLAGQESDLARTRSDELVRLLLDLFVRGPFEEPRPALPDILVAVSTHVRRVWEVDGMRIVEVPELARAAGLSPGHLFRLFRTHFDCGPARALELLRLARAAALLQRSNATLDEVAAQTGFANAYHFSRRFAAVYACPPGAFRNRGGPVDPWAPVRSAGLLPLAQLVLRSRGTPSG